MNFDEFASASRPGAAATVSAPPAATAADRPSVPVSTAPAPLFVGRADRSRAFPLEHPLEFEGRTYDTIIMRRPNANQVGEFFAEYAAAIAANPAALVYFPVFVDAAGAPIPPAVLDALDDDDRFPLFDAVTDFLPRRLLPFRGGFDLGSVPDDGASTAPTSSN